MEDNATLDRKKKDILSGRESLGRMSFLSSVLLNTSACVIGCNWVGGWRTGNEVDKISGIRPAIRVDGMFLFHDVCSSCELPDDVTISP